MPFWPDTPLTIAYAVALAVACLIALRGGRAGRIGAAVMAANWLATRAVTAWDLESGVMLAADLAAGLALVLGWLRVRSTMAVLPLAAVFGLMVFVDAAQQLEFLGREALWAMSDVGGYVQLLCLAGIGLAPGGGLRLWLGRRAGRGSPALAPAVARRVPPARPS